MLERFLNKIQPQGDDGCWLWTGALSGGERGGYGYFWIGGTAQPAHRVAWFVFKGELPSDYEIDHTCRVRNCVNPRHLTGVTHQENCQRGAKARLANGGVASMAIRVEAV